MKPVTKKIILTTISTLIFIGSLCLYYFNPLNKSTVDVASPNYNFPLIVFIFLAVLIVGEIVIRKRVDTEKRYIAKEYFHIVISIALGLLYFLLR